MNYELRKALLALRWSLNMPKPGNIVFITEEGCKHLRVNVGESKVPYKISTNSIDAALFVIKVERPSDIDRRQWVVHVLWEDLIYRIRVPMYAGIDLKQLFLINKKPPEHERKTEKHDDDFFRGWKAL
jgi:hypothetical protein